MSNAPANWYPVDDHERWWDGTQWSDQTRPIPVTRTSQFATSLRSSSSQVVANVKNREQEQRPDQVWGTVGKTISGIGGGRYSLTRRFLFFEKGVVRTNAQQIPVEDIYDVDASQSMPQKARGVGTIVIQVKRAAGMEVVRLEDIPDFRAGVSALNDTAIARRLELQQQANTQTFNHASVFQQPVAPADKPSADEIFDNLEKLGRLRDAGVVTSEEFDRKKSELLDRL